MSRVDLSRTCRRGYGPGRSIAIRLLWLAVEFITLLNPVFLPSTPKAHLLRLFGSRVEGSAYIKPVVHIKHPWRLSLGRNVWIGEKVWIDNLVPVHVGSNVCISQGVYLCTGNHDWSDPGMGMTPAPITIQDGAWIGAFAKIGPGVTVGEEAVVTMGSVLLSDAEPRGVYQGNPAVKIRERTLRDYFGPKRSRPVDPVLDR